MITKLDIAREVAEKEDISIQNVYSLIDTVIDVIAVGLEKDNVQLPGLGTFKRKTLQAREGRNPRTGEPIHIPERIVVRFKASKGLASSNGRRKASGKKSRKNGERQQT